MIKLAISIFLTLSLVISFCAQAKVNYETDVTSLYAEMSENTLSVTSKVKGKQVVVTGKVKSVGETMSGRAQIVMTDGLVSKVGAVMVESERNALIGLRSGDAVVVVCSDEINQIVFPRLADCVLKSTYDKAQEALAAKKAKDAKEKEQARLGVQQKAVQEQDKKAAQAEHLRLCSTDANFRKAKGPMCAGIRFTGEE